MHQRNIAARHYWSGADAASGSCGGARRRWCLWRSLWPVTINFFLNLAMAAGKVLTDPANGVEHSTLVTTMARNGTEFGIRVSGHGERWFMAPVNLPSGLYFPSFGETRPIRTWAIALSWRRSGLAVAPIAASPAAARFVGAGGMAEALQVTAEMRDICVGEHPHFRIPILDERGTPLGLDLRLVIETGLTPSSIPASQDVKRVPARSAQASCALHSPASLEPWRRF